MRTSTGGVVLLLVLGAALRPGGTSSADTCSVSNCNKCKDPPVKCDSCTKPQLLKSDGSECLSCPSDCTTCDEKADGTGTSCTACNKFFYLVTGTCSRCPGHCQVCSSTGVCQTCEKGYTKKSAGTACTACSSNCLTCADENTCWTCKDGYYLDSTTNTCKACPKCSGSSCAACIGCTDDKKCTTCKDSKWDETKKGCIKCQDNCVTCDTTNGCTKCAKDYFLSSDKLSCHSCANCDGSCSDNSGCSKCKPGFHKVPDGRCLSCHLYTYTQDSCPTCVAPSRGQYWDTNECKYCAENCVACTNADTCTTCKQGTGWVSTTKKCVDCSEITTFDETNCAQCAITLGQYWDVSCKECAAQNLAADSNACEAPGCGKPSKHGKDWECKAISCTTSLTVQADCEACSEAAKKVYWKSDTTECKAADCTLTDPSSITDEKQCKACPEYQWHTGACRLIETACDTAASLTNERDCLSCDKEWKATECKDPAPCATAATEADCYCGGYYWNGFKCVADTALTTCDTDVTTLKKWDCKGCAKKNMETASATAVVSWNELDTFSCHECPEKCTDCTYLDGNIDSCQACEAGYSPHHEKLECTACKNEGCATCDHTTHACSTCLTGYTKVSTKCEACPANCDNCDSGKTTCDQCKTSYIWDSTSKECVDCVYETGEECTGCSNPTKTAGFYFDDNNLCQGCTTGCLSCTADDKCQSCVNSYYLKDEACTACAASPSDGTVDETSCGACNAFFYSTKGVFWDSDTTTCKSCLTNCLECSDATSCKKCRDGYYFKSGDSPACTKCIDKCTSCTSGTDCKTCDTGRYFNRTSNTCKSCDTKCNTTASACTTTNGCSVCEDKYYLQDQTCIACTTIDANCISCSDSSACLACEVGYFAKDAKCIACPENCKTCDSATSCTACSTGYCWDAKKKKCQSATGCNTCAEGSDGKITCSECAIEYSLAICQTCSDSNCIKCDSDPAKCQTCKDGYYLDGTTCKQCPGLDKCLKCSGSTKCDSCAGGFWDTKGKTCKDCGTNCLNCSSDTTCSRCDTTNMYWNATAKECKSCPYECAACAGDTSCTTCNNGTVWVEKDMQCTECLTNCWKCQNATVCSTCLPGYYLKDSTSGHTCESCGTGCTVCSEVNKTVTCSSCQDGYVLNSKGACDECGISDCATCSDPGEYCTVCNSGFMLTSEKLCAETCYSCSGTGCDKVQDANSTMAACDGMGSSASCKTTMVMEGSSVTYTRECAQQACTNTTEQCSTVTSGEDQSTTTCMKCCVGSSCNGGLLDGPAESGGSHVHVGVAGLLSLLISLMLNY